jgi:hypothetical protein
MIERLKIEGIIDSFSMFTLLKYEKNKRKLVWCSWARPFATTWIYPIHGFE